MSVTNTRTCSIDKYVLYQRTFEKNRMFSTQKCENFFSLASLARGNYHVKILLKSVMITITLTVSYENYDNKYFRATDVRNKYFNFFFVDTFGTLAPPPYQKAGYATDEPLQEKS